MVDYSIKRYSSYTDEELISALKQFAEQNKAQYISCRNFCNWRGISESTISRHFKSWTNFCEKGGLHSRYNRTKNKDDLLQNLGKVWDYLGRQPRSKEMKQPLSHISCSRYTKEFGTWYKACLEFLAWKSGLSVEAIIDESKVIYFEESDSNPKRKTKREITLSLRYEVLKRDSFKCKKCGRSPATESKVVLHIDHIQPYSKGGETFIDNLQTLCSDCNLGKSNKSNV